MKSILLLICSLFTLSLLATEEAEKNMKAFHEAPKGMKRHVILLPHKARGEEQSFRVELIAGKTMMTDGVNRMMMGGSIHEQTVKGWGFRYYEVESGAVASTLMAPGPGAAQVERFVHMQGKLLPYNSRIPLVVYAAEDLEIKYRIWSAGDDMLEAESR